MPAMYRLFEVGSYLILAIYTFVCWVIVSPRLERSSVRKTSERVQLVVGLSLLLIWAAGLLVISVLLERLLNVRLLAG